MPTGTPTTTLTMTRTSSTGGNFNAQIDLDAEVTFTNNSTGASSTVSDYVSMTTSGATWKETPSAGTVTVSSPRCAGRRTSTSSAGA